MVDIEKRELNKLCKAYNNIHDFNNFTYVKSDELDLYNIKEGLKDQIEEIIIFNNKKDIKFNLNFNIEYFTINYNDLKLLDIIKHPLKRLNYDLKNINNIYNIFLKRNKLYLESSLYQNKNIDIFNTIITKLIEGEL